MIDCVVCNLRFTGATCYQQHLASEKHKKKELLERSISSTSSLTQGKIDEPFPCSFCSKEFNSFSKYQEHVNSLEHVDNVKAGTFEAKKFKPEVEDNIVNELLEETSIDHNKSMNSSLDKSLSETQTNPPFWCSACEKNLCGPVPYQAHIIGKSHQKKLKEIEVLKNLKTSQSIQGTGIKASVSTNSKGSNINYYHCKVCNIPLSGPEPYRQHINSVKHMKKANQAKIVDEIDNPTSPAPSKPNSLNPPRGKYDCETCNMSFTGFDPWKDHTVSIGHKKNSMAKSSPSVTGQYYCDICSVPCSGPAQYKQHIEGAPHHKAVLRSKVSFTGGSLSNDTDESSNDSVLNKSDLIFPELFETASLKDMNVTLFKVDEEIDLDALG